MISVTKLWFGSDPIHKNCSRPLPVANLRAVLLMEVDVTPGFHQRGIALLWQKCD